MTNFYKFMFFSSLILGSIITMSSYSWYMMWLGMEINLLSLIPLMLNENSPYSSESSLKYFIIQALASTMMMFSMIIMEMNFSLSMMELFDLPMMFLYTALFMKLGMSPFHVWFPEVIEGLKWNSCLLILTWQKIAPMSIMMMALMNNYFMMVVIIYSSIISGIMGLNQISLRKILAYSSINHMSWMIMTMMNSFNLWLLYFSVYSITNIFMIMYFSKMKISKINQIWSFNLSKTMKFIVLGNFLSLSGLPPMIGFLPKWLTISFMVKESIILMAVMLIFTTLLSIYFYLRMLFPLILLKSSKFKNNSMKLNFNSFIFIMNTLFLTSLPLCNILF